MFNLQNEPIIYKTMKIEYEMRTKLLFGAFAATFALFVGAACDDNADGMPSEMIEPLPENLRPVLTDGKNG